jgi:membrane protein implicated in regulation of membrane protease activity
VSFWSSLIAWANVPFTVALGVAVVFAMLSLSGVLGWLAGDGDDADGHDADGHDADGDADDGDHDDGAEGKLPMSVAWQTFSAVFGVVGLAMNTPFLSRGGAPAMSLLWTLPAAAFVAWIVTRLAGRVLARFTSGSEATSRQELVGQAGVVISTRVDGAFGEVRIKDKHGHVLRLVCRSETEIPEGHEVVVVDADADRVVVAPLEG